MNFGSRDRNWDSNMLSFGGQRLRKVNSRSPSLGKPQPSCLAQSPLEIVRSVLIHESFTDHGKRLEKEKEVAKWKSRHLYQDDNVPPPFLVLSAWTGQSIMDPTRELRRRCDRSFIRIGAGKCVSGAKKRALGGRRVMPQLLGDQNNYKQTQRQSSNGHDKWQPYSYEHQ